MSTRAAVRGMAAWLRTAAVLAVTLAGCASLPDQTQVSLPMPQPRQSEAVSAAEREHQRILASYGGVYENARVQAMIEQTVARLVAASERPDLKYQVTLLNSPAINAF